MCKPLAGVAPGLPGAAIRFGANVETISFGGKQMLTLETKLKELGLQAGEIFKDRFVFYRSFADQLERLSDKPEIVVALVRATYRYGLDMQEPDFGGDVVLEALFAPIKAQLDANWVRTLNGTNGKEYGIKGGRPTGDKNPTKTPPEPQENPTEPPNIKGNIKGKGKGKDNGNIEGMGEENQKQALSPPAYPYAPQTAFGSPQASPGLPIDFFSFDDELSKLEKEYKEQGFPTFREVYDYIVKLKPPQGKKLNPSRLKSLWVRITEKGWCYPDKRSRIYPESWQTKFKKESATFYDFDH